MTVQMQGMTLARPLLDGEVMNAVHDGQWLWPMAKDQVSSVRVLAENGGSPPTKLSVSGSVKLACRATYGDGHESDLLTTDGVMWKVKDPSVATMTGNTLTWKHGGTALVTATVDGTTSPALSIACSYAPETITVSPTSVTTSVGAKTSVTVQVLPAAAAQDFTASITEPSIASITKE